MNVKLKRVNWLTILIAFNCGLLVLNVAIAWKIFAHQPPRQTLLDILLNRAAEAQTIDYKDFISIMLTGLSAMITVLGIGLATIAIWGYGQIKEEAKQAAVRVAEQRSAQANVAYQQERLSVAEARAELENLPSVPPEKVQNLVDALAYENERGTSNLRDPGR